MRIDTAVCGQKSKARCDVTLLVSNIIIEEIVGRSNIKNLMEKFLEENSGAGLEDRLGVI